MYHFDLTARICHTQKCVPKIHLKTASRQHLKNHNAFELHMQCLLVSDLPCEAKIFSDCYFASGLLICTEYEDKMTLHMFNRKTFWIQTSALSVTE